MYDIAIRHNRTFELVRRPFIKAIVTTPDNIQFMEGVHLRGGGPEIGINGTFFNRKTGITSSIMQQDGHTIGYGVSTHLWVPEPAQANTPESVLYWDGKKFGHCRVRTVQEVPDSKWAVGGCGMSPGIYDPEAEGFDGPYSDPLRWTNHNVIGAKDGLVWLMYLRMNGERMLRFSKYAGFDLMVLLDGGSPAVITTDRWGYGDRTWVCKNGIFLKNNQIRRNA